MTTWRDRLPSVRGRLSRDTLLAPFTWLRVGGPADVLFLPADEADLAAFLRALDPGVPVTVLGNGSNTLIRDGGVDGIVVRLTHAFATVNNREEGYLRAGAAALDTQVARAAAAAGVAGLEFLIGVPGSIGGALVMNAGCYGAEIREVLVEAQALTRRGEAVTLAVADLGYDYRLCRAAVGGDLLFISALFKGYPDTPEAVRARMTAITERREAAQPIREKTGGSTFKNPTPERSAWSLIDAVGWRGRPLGGAMFSPQHANFLINLGDATAADLEMLGETVLEVVANELGFTLEWEIRRIGRR